MTAATLCAVPLARSGRPGRAAQLWAVLTGVLTVVWFLHKAPYEGPTIIQVTATRGLTVVDLVVPPALAAAAAVLWRSRARSSRA